MVFHWELVYQFADILLLILTAATLSMLLLNLDSVAIKLQHYVKIISASHLGFLYLIFGLLNVSMTKNCFLYAMIWAGCCWMMACENDYEKIQDLQRKKLTVDEVKNVESYLSQAGNVKAKLTAPFMLRYYDSVPRVEFPNKLHVDFYNDSMVTESYLDARRGYYYEQQNRVVLNDSVVVIRINGDTLKTQELYWDQNLHKLFTKADVEIRQKTKTIFGKGFESDEQLKNFTIDSVKGVLLVGDSKFVGN
jgi:LPS export ABC transporter protein LptC